MAASLNVPTQTTGYATTQKYNIENATYYMNWYYNYRSGWYVSLYDADQTALREGVKIMPGRNLYAGTEIFEGAFLVVDTDPIYRDYEVTRDNFGDGLRYQVWYFSSTELDALEAGTYTA